MHIRTRQYETVPLDDDIPSEADLPDAVPPKEKRRVLMTIRQNLKRAVAVLLSLLMLTCCVPPVTCSANGEGTTPTDSFPTEEALELVYSLLKSIPTEIFGSGVSWGTEALLNVIFGKELNDTEAAAFRQILAEIQDLQNAVSDLKNSVEGNALDTLLQAYSQLAASQLPAVIHHALEIVDETTGQTEEWKKQQRLSILTDGIGAGGENLGNVDTDFDRYVSALSNALLNTSYVTVEGHQQNLMLFQVHYEYLRRKYHWEHQALDEWYGFQSQAMGILVETLAIERLSLHARLERITEYNKGKPESEQISPLAVQSALDYLEGKPDVNPDLRIIGTLDKVRALYIPNETGQSGKNPDWMPSPHSDDERYYWTPGHEILFYAQVNTQNVPKEPRQDLGWHDAYSGGGELRGITNDSTDPDQTRIAWAFWKPFFRPEGMRLLTEAELKNIFNDYNNNASTRKSFYEIFMDEDEGNFQGLVGEKDGEWKIVFDPDSHHLEMHWPFGTDECTVEGYFFDAMDSSSMPKAKRMKIARYHQYYNREINDTFFIGLRVKEVSGEAPEVGGVHLSIHKDEIPSGWIPEDGDISIGMDPEIFREILRVEADGAVLPASCWSASDNLTVLKASYLKTLEEGVHTFTVCTGGGSISYTLSFGVPAEIVLPDSLRELDHEALAGIGARSVRISDSCMRIGEGTLAGCENLAWIYIPDAVTSIGAGAFNGCPNLILICSENSAAAGYAEANGIPFRILRGGLS